MESTRSTLLTRLRDVGDQAAWREFADRYGDLLLRSCRRFGLQPADAHDVRQIVMMNLTSALPRFVYKRERGHFRDYLGAIVRNAIHRHVTRQNRRPMVLVGDVGELLSADGDRAWSNAWNEEWQLHHYRRAMAHIRATFHERSLAIFDGLLEGRSGDDLARAFETTPAAVYKIKQRIRERLEQLIAAQLREEEHPDERALGSQA